MSDFVSHMRNHLSDDRELVFVRDNGETTRLTFAELDRRARAGAVWLTERGMTDHPALLLYPAGLDFTVAFLACLYARVPAIPAPLPETGTSHSGRVRTLLDDAGARMVLTDSAHVTALSDLSACVIDTGSDPDTWTPPVLSADTIAYLQYTSGSTSEPRGVEISHGNLLHNLELFRALSGAEPPRRLAGWLPHYHDMGLVGLQLQALYLGADLVFMSPIAFVARPVRWLQLITRYGADWTVSPDFGYAWCTRRITDEQLAELDLSTLTMALSGAEPIKAATFTDFERRFAPAGFRPTTWNPGYGLAECTLMVTCTPRGQGVTVRSFDPSALERHQAIPDPDGVPLVACGPALGLDLRIVSPENSTPVPDGGIGEIWVSGPSVALGYRGRPEETRATFRAGDGHWLRTGDLGFLLDGRLYVTGRIKDVIIVNGRNLYPQDLEEAAARANLTAGRSAAFGVRRPDGGEHVVLIQEVRRGHSGALGETADQVMDAVAREFGIPLSLMLVPRGAVRQTTSGKLRRRHMRELFLGGGLTPLHTELEPAVNTLLATVP
ncbi:Acyl-CoA synthetase (AMP-forming)/AMP-acid ligase II [Sinosporangium album]|uniref:Acyl-CoA synthetase (AMP-forming)/AMP-acid ligase II n=1 Tax=Sinosporangium album TaxID=504805 RepID=A0A1G7ZPW3_9ACTN|nr:fatty acyl-AMP ligase [Sinosporangium album]SDH10586.1 Acyl-CoA synthetase (AMP-forming)/AMP-acid ligase II [Sinosporangium album]